MLIRMFCIVLFYGFGHEENGVIGFVGDGFGCNPKRESQAKNRGFEIAYMSSSLDGKLRFRNVSYVPKATLSLQRECSG